MPTSDRDRGGRGGHETETDDLTTTHQPTKTKTKTKTVQHPLYNYRIYIIHSKCDKQRNQVDELIKTNHQH